MGNSQLLKVTSVFYDTNPCKRTSANRKVLPLIYCFDIFGSLSAAIQEKESKRLFFLREPFCPGLPPDKPSVAVNPTRLLVIFRYDPMSRVVNEKVRI
jgi:hypothetical protein